MKNPWMSLWLSAANRAAGTARGLWMAEAQRQQRALARKMANAGEPGAPAAKKRSGAKRRKG